MAESESLTQKYREFFQQNGWEFSEVVFDPWDPTEVVYEVQVGYTEPQTRIKAYLEGGTGLLMVTGSPGWGKSHITLHSTSAMQDRGYVSVYFDVPPPTERDFVEQIAYELHRQGVLRKPLSYLFKPFEVYAAALGLFNLKRQLSKVRDTIVLVCDEAHSGDPARALNWFKSVNDDKKINSKLIFVGYESERVSLKEVMEKTFSDRTFDEIHLNGLDRDEIGELIKKRLKHKCGDKAKLTAFENVIDYVQRKSGGRPRFALKVMSKLWRYMAAKDIREAELTDIKPIIDQVEGEEQRTPRGEVTLTDFTPPEPDKAPDFSILPDFMRKLCKTIAEFPGSSADELAGKLNTNRHIIWSNLARLALKDKTYQNRFIRANIVDPIVFSRKERVGKKMLKCYFLNEKFKGEFVK